MAKLDAVTLILSGARGTYIPRDFLTDSYNEIVIEHCNAWGLTEENKTHWEDAANPESEYYWESWDWILNNAKYVDEEGNVYELWQDGDLWGICFERMTKEEKESFGFEVDDEGQTFEYYINLDERGEFFADVRDESGNTVFELHGYQMFDDGFMSDSDDMDGLKAYLIEQGIMSEEDKLVDAN